MEVYFFACGYSVAPTLFTEKANLSSTESLLHSCQSWRFLGRAFSEVSVVPSICASTLRPHHTALITVAV